MAVTVAQAKDCYLCSSVSLPVAHNHTYQRVVDDAWSCLFHCVHVGVRWHHELGSELCCVMNSQLSSCGLS